jgi:tight adherence protein C
MLLLLATFTFALAVFVVGELATQPQRRLRLAMKRATRYGRVGRQGAPAELLHFRERVVTPTVQRLATLALRLNPKVTAEAIGIKLLAAGLSSRITPTQFLALKAALAIAGVVASFTVGAATAPIAGILLAPVLAGAGFLLPGTGLMIAIRSRRERIRSELPDALDILAVSVEAGLGLDGAVAKLTENMEGALVDEFALTLGEMRIGEARHDALKKLAERVPSPEVAAFVRAVIQADQLGISLGRILRVQAADSRLRRQAAAEERAMKAPIKMLFPTALFIFPAMFVVILGPALLNLMQAFK